MSQTIKDTLPYSLGAVDPDRVKLEHELRLAKRRLKLAQRDLGKLNPYPSSGRGVGKDSLPKPSRTPTTMPLLAQDRVTQLRSEVDGHWERFRTVQGQIEAAEVFERESGRYATEAGEQRSRLQSIQVFRNVDGPHQCPGSRIEESSRV